MNKFQVIVFSAVALVVVSGPAQAYRQTRQTEGDEAVEVEVGGEVISELSSIPGLPGLDYPIYDYIPETDFSCSGRIPGYYADVETGCQVWHYCNSEGVANSFLCNNGTTFSQKSRTCDWWYNVNCTRSADDELINADLYILPEPKPPKTNVEVNDNPSKAHPAKPESVNPAALDGEIDLV